MAEGYLRKFLGERATVYSAGVETHGLNPKAVEVMREDGVDISHHTSNHIDEYGHIPFDLLLTVCDHAQERCPYFPAAKILHHSFPDPARVVGEPDEVMQAFRNVRDEIKATCRTLSGEWG